MSSLTPITGTSSGTLIPACFNARIAVTPEMSSFANNPHGVGKPAICRHAICAICLARTFGGNDDDGISNTRHS